MPRLVWRALAALFVAALFALGPAGSASAQGLLPGLLSPPAPAPAPPPPTKAAPVAPPGSAGVPDASGTGRRVVYSNGQQRVWLVEEDGRVDSTYLVSGRRGDPDPGTYRVFSRSRHARSGSVTMEYMVRFAHTPGLDIGFHAIPVGKRGPIQSESELGQYRSRGCVRQSVADAAHLWDWAPIGTPVVVTP